MIGAVVVLYNPTQNEVENINTYNRKVDYIIIVDNSDKDNKKFVSGILNGQGNVEYYSEHKNLGLCKGFNLGVKRLKEKGCEWAILFDADSKIESDIFTIYKNAINDYKNIDVAVFAPVHIFDRSNSRAYKGYKEVSWSMTSGWLVNIEIFHKQGGFFEELFVDGLDMDYCFKSHENGYKVIECGEAIINHKPAETRQFLGFKYGIASPFRYYMQARQLIWCWKRYSNNKCLLIYLYKWIKVILFFQNKFDYIKQIKKGTKDGKTLYTNYSKKGCE